MRCFGLYPDQVVPRIQSSGTPPRPLDAAASIARGAVGFALVLVCAYSVWAVGGRTLVKAIGEGGMYAACAVVAIGLGGIVLKSLVIGGSLPRFFGLFTLVFGAYAIAWCLAWFGLRAPLGGRAAEWIGSLAGTAVMGILVTCAFGARGVVIPVILALFVMHSAGYFVGGMAYAALGKQYPLLSKLSWGLAHGLGLGAGLGYAFYRSQETTRAQLSKSP